MTSPSTARKYHELITPQAFKTKEFNRGLKAGKSIFWPEEDATYWYVDGYVKASQEPQE